jgi:large subunit ribosomal protein L7/L12|tara:strand:- start:277 stop:642 length:366 start_codon:yes stop_codon:yes gene_type:complete
MANIDILVKELGQLTVLEALDLSKKLAKEWNIDLDALQAAPAQVAEVVEESTTATVMLTSFAAGKKIPMIKAVRPILDLGLLEAKNFVEDLPKTIKEDIEKDEAEKLKKVLEEAGGTVELK